MDSTNVDLDLDSLFGVNNFDSSSSENNSYTTLMQIQWDFHLIKQSQEDVQKSSNEQKQSIQNLEISIQKLTNEFQTFRAEQKQRDQYLFSLLKQLVQREPDQRVSSIEQRRIDQSEERPQIEIERSIDNLISSKVMNGKIPIAQWCSETNLGTTDDAPALITSTAHVSASSSQVQNIPNAVPLNYELSQQTKPPQIEPKISYLHPFDERISAQSDRDTILKDIYGQPPVLVLTGCPFPVDAQIEIAAVSRSDKGIFYSPHKFRIRTGNYERIEYRSIDLTNTNCQRIKLDNLKLRKMVNNDMKSNEQYVVQSYPMGPTEDTKISSPKELYSQYKFDSVQIAIRIIGSDGRSLTNTLYSNCLTTEGKVKLLQPYQWKINALFSSGKPLAFDLDNQMHLGYHVEIPREFHGTIHSGLKFLRIFLECNNQPSVAYLVSPEIVPIEKESFDVNLSVRKKTLEEFLNTRDIPWLDSLQIDQTNLHEILKKSDLLKFNIRMNICHQDNPPLGEMKTYEKCLVYESSTFTEETNMSQKRTFDQMNEVR